MDSNIFVYISIISSVLLAAAIIVIFNLTGKKKSRKEKKNKSKSEPNVTEPSEMDIIHSEGNKALSEMGRVYSSAASEEIRPIINELMRLTDKIIQDGDEDPSDIPQIKKFVNHYLPSTLKQLSAYERMNRQETSGEILDKSMSNIVDMLNDSVTAYRKLLDSLFANQALDIETDIEVMNSLLSREGLTENKDFK